MIARAMGNMSNISSEAEFTDGDFQRIAAIAYSDAGISLPSTKKTLVYSRLSKRLRKLGIQRFAEYCDLIESDSQGEERVKLISALTTNVTRFLREAHHFEYLREEVLPGLITRARQGGRVRLWSAGCATGEEVYSIAFTVLEMCPDAAKLDLRILATDIDTEALNFASAGIYPETVLPSVPDEIQRKYFEVSGQTRGQMTVSPDLRNLIAFRHLNFMTPWPVKGPFDVIFCRNVAIYFDEPTQQRLWGKFASVLGPGSTFCIGHSERITGPAKDLFQLSGTTIYTRREDMPATGQELGREQQWH